MSKRWSANDGLINIVFNRSGQASPGELFAALACWPSGASGFEHENEGRVSFFQADEDTRREEGMKKKNTSPVMTPKVQKAKFAGSRSQVPFFPAVMAGLGAVAATVVSENSRELI